MSLTRGLSLNLHFWPSFQLICNSFVKAIHAEEKKFEPLEIDANDFITELEFSLDQEIKGRIAEATETFKM